MSTPVHNKPDETRLGECSPLQPLSGVTSVTQTFAVNGLGRGGYVRLEEVSKPATARP